MVINSLFQMIPNPNFFLKKNPSKPPCHPQALNQYHNGYQSSGEAEVEGDNVGAVVEAAVVEQDLHVLKAFLGRLAFRALRRAIENDSICTN
jgi:hypothetical protein